MIHILERKHLIRWIINNCTRKIVVRAMEEGSVENLGWFTKLGPDEDPGWTVKVTSERGKVWYVEVVPRRNRMSVYINENKPMWGNWDGSGTIDICLINGDRPQEYMKLRGQEV